MAITIEKDGQFWKVKDGNKIVYKSKDEKKALDKYNRYRGIETRRETLREKAAGRFYG